MIALLLLATSAAGPPESVQAVTRAPQQQPAALQLTLADFERVQIGMSLDQVMRLLGPPSKTVFETQTMGLHLITYQWGDGLTSMILVTFQNGRVSMRTQMGLN